jgi:transposase
MAQEGRWLTGTLWEKIPPVLLKLPRQRHGGRPRTPDRLVLEGILWMLRSGTGRQDLPEEFPPPVT